MIHFKQDKCKLVDRNSHLFQFISLAVIINSSLAWKKTHQNLFSQVIYSIFIKTFYYSNLKNSHWY